jgi:hypothetical protein
MLVALRPLVAPLSLALIIALPAAAAEKIEFSRDVLPILSANCFVCHGRDASTREAKLRLDGREHATAPLRSGFTPIVPGKPEASELIARITSKDEDERMPPADKGRALNAAEIATLRAWIAQGADYTEHWAFLPLKRPPVPVLHRASASPTPHSNIDAFIRAKLETANLKPAPPASRETLLRRATLDLTGLLPTPAELEAFLADASPDAFAKVVDRLLASPHYGERWGRHWLDIARYADSGGFETDIFFGHAWRYRDYVIRSFNADKPFDRFIKEQIAGDELFPNDPEARLATGLYTTGPVLQEAGMVAGKLEYDQNTDFADTTGAAFMGLTVGCARCHDHKYDPISQKEYFSLQAIFNASDQFDFAADGTKLRDRAALKNTQKEFEAEQSRERAKRETDPIKRAALIRKTGDAFIDADPALKFRIDSTRRFNLIARAVEQYNAAVAGQPVPAASEDPLDADPDDNNETIAMKALLLGLRDELKAEPAAATLLNVGAVALLNPPPRPPRGPGRNRDNAAAGKDASAAGQIADVTKGGSPTRPTQSADKLAAALADETKGGAAQTEPRPPADAKAGVVALQQPSAAGGGGFGSRRAFSALAGATERREFLLKLGEQQLALSKPEGYVDDIDGLRLAAGEKHLNDPSPIPNRFLAHKEKIPDTVLLKRGELEMPGEIVPPALPEKFGGKKLDEVPANRRRAALAEWIASPRHVLTARVIANRVWQWHFGEGLVRTPNDFGVRGDIPTHPELLDWLATELTQNGWRLKHLHRLIMNSAAYQMAATADRDMIERDPENRLLARFQPHRLEAEVIWDNLRAAAGTLDRTLFGMPIAPPLDEQEQLGNYRKWPASTPEESNRRAIYILVKRSFRFPMLSAFDLPDNITSCGRRDITTVPNQALTLLNNRTMRQQAAAFAARLVRETNGKLDDAPARAWLHAYGRRITPDERQQALAFIRDRTMNGDAKPALTELCLAIFNTNEFIYQQ